MTTKPLSTDPTLVRIDGVFHWQFADGTTLRAISGGDGETTPSAPADLAELDDDALTALSDELVAEFDRLHDEGSRDIGTLTALADDIDRVRAEREAREQAEAEADATVESLRNRVHGSNDDPDTDDDDAETDADDDEDAEASADDNAEASTEGDAEAAADGERELATVAASARPAANRRPALGDVARRAPRPAPARRREPNQSLEASLVASVDFPGAQPDTAVTLDQVAEAFHARASVMAVGKHRARVARLNTPFAAEQTLTADASHNAEVLRNGIPERTAEALVAAGGWCAPSTPVFDLFDMGPDTDNLFDVPTFGSDVRAGILVPSFFTHDDAYDAFWTWTETADINALGSLEVDGAVADNVATLNTSDDHGLSVGNTVRLSGLTGTASMPDGDYVVTEVIDADTFTVATDAADGTVTAGTLNQFKHCMRIPCPTWTEFRMEAEGLCVTHGNLANEAWPELTRDFLRVVMATHRRYMSAKRIAKVVNDLTSVTPVAGPSDVAGDLLGIIELQATDMRSQFKVSRRRTVEALIPEWLLPVLRANMAMRAGVDNFMNVTDAQITGWLTARGIRPQFSPDYQPLHDGTPATDWPSDVEIGMWFGGSYFSLAGGRIDLGVQRDPEMNAVNDYTAAWSEEFYQVGRRGPAGRKFTYTLTDKIDGVTACCDA